MSKQLKVTAKSSLMFRVDKEEPQLSDLCEPDKHSL